MLVDHRQLKVKVGKSLDKEKPRVLRFLERLQPFSFSMDWVEGKKHRIADALSRAPIVKAGDEDWNPEEERPSSYAMAALETAAKRASKWSSPESGPSVGCCYVAKGNAAPAAANAARADLNFFHDHAEEDEE